MNQRVLLIDTDPQGHVAAIFNVKPLATFHNLMIDGLKPEECWQEVRPNLSCIFSTKTTAATEQLLVGMIARERVLAERMKTVNNFDFILIDTPPSISVIQQNTIYYSRNLLIPVDMDYLSLIGARQIVDLSSSLREHLQIDYKIFGIIPTFVDARKLMTDAVLSELKQQYGDHGIPLFAPIRVDANLAKAAAKHQTIFEFEKTSRAAEDFLKVAKHLCRRTNEELKHHQQA
jgi:chromosome partitioning protein